MSSIWQALTAFFLAIGGVSAVIFVLAFIGKSLFVQFLAARTKVFEAELKIKTDSQIEQFKNSLEMAAMEHQIRFSGLHAKRAEVIAELYRRLVEAFRTAQRYFFQMGLKEQQGEGYVATMNEFQELYRFAEINRIYFPDSICGLLEKFIGEIQQPVIGTFVYGSIEYPNPQTLKEKNEAFKAAYHALEHDIPTLRKALEDEFRGILGGNKS